MPEVPNLELSRRERKITFQQACVRLSITHEEKIRLSFQGCLSTLEPLYIDWYLFGIPWDSSIDVNDRLDIWIEAEQEIHAFEKDVQLCVEIKKTKSIGPELLLPHCSN